MAAAARGGHRPDHFDRPLRRHVPPSASARRHLGEWPLNVADAEQAAELVPVLRAIAAADLHNLVFQRDWRIVPALHPQD
ncbi:hypothetical protein ACQP1V_41950 [Microtetraspora malaysiensis]|uniref:hypothetical protein n=1 Tax=Microtetraspora malaysiensis TaxID=161358 RepID=UPI003D8AD39C